MILKETTYNKKYEKTFFALGTINTIVVYGSSCEDALNSACRRILEIDYRMSAFKNDSDVMQINHYAGLEAQKINIDTFNLLKRALDFSRTSGGSFDITIRPLTELWGFGSKQNYVPERKMIEKILPLVNYKDVLLDDKKCTVFLKNKGQAIDLGGIAKGYAADEVKRVLLQYKIENALINLGGNIITMGHNPTGASWRIGIQNPLSVRGQYIGRVSVTNKTVVTSGSNEQFFIKEGKRYHHIIDPRTGYPSKNELLSVTILCECSTDADAVTTALFVQDINKSISLLKSINAEAIFILKNKDILVTEGLLDNFERRYHQ
ncbi:FAD:protein FMN transferase [Clostridium kluyveri]|uniref:FAD:protein FMN transferase n=1 Tax=Clostridium kluyveri TaxID=1534 RepID=UPI0022468BD6|nr:FAD:protein FMN transferase [Clostridium kluyveri]UZQ51202.1 FAD:protein FMN transferase [Clostridium kluyveri]